ncbi:MAG: cell division protein ZipA C-terminal FtsZ-binding domain-containing protein [Burkholderiaceae bacterium]|nr:cell division protein ZipA C-terminal FtsZ-binding domain-containing protein [Burkholderiaceae bacterium]
MNSLLFGLTIAGGVVLAGVVAHGTWTARKGAPKLAQDNDALLAALTPVFDPSQHAAPPAAHGLQIEPVFSTTQFDGQFESDLVVVSAPDKKLNLDPLIDVITAIQLDSVISGDAALAAMPATRRVGSKPFAVEGLREAGAEWETPKPGQRYYVLQAGVQLANRTGALNEIEYSEFVVKTQAFADALGGTPDFPEMRDEVARARELDVFASTHDAQLRFTLHAVGAAWSAGYVAQNAARLGFVAGALPGRMVLPGRSANLPPLITLSFDSQAAMADDAITQSAMREIALSLDVPHVDKAEQPFARMRECAKALAVNMDGMVCDDQGMRINDAALDGIAADLEQLYHTLELRDLSAGSPLARRLFS